MVDCAGEECAACWGQPLGERQVVLVVIEPAPKPVEPHEPSATNRFTPDSDGWFASQVQPHEAMLRAWLAQGFGPRLAIDDVVQEAFLRVLRARTTEELHSPKAFLFATARNLALDQLRRHHVSRTDS